MRELDVQALRFPGGSLSDTYHWATHTTVGKPRNWPTSFTNFIHGGHDIGAQVFITVNYGLGHSEGSGGLGASCQCHQ
jgi:alpha-L-arabinofuranosidase